MSNEDDSYAQKLIAELKELLKWRTVRDPETGKMVLRKKTSPREFRARWTRRQRRG